jgi:hypothetical protein
VVALGEGLRHACDAAPIGGMDKLQEEESVVIYRIARLAVAFTILVGSLTHASWARACNSPLILDLNNDGIHTTDLGWAVSFDIDSDGTPELTGWTLPQSEDAFLWLDLNRNGVADSGLELFGDATLLPDGTFARHGFEALAVYDSPEMGGNGDGLISQLDLVWEHLLLWKDRNHDGRSDRGEVSRLKTHSIIALELDYEELLAYDDALNLHRYQGSFTRAVRPVLDIRPEKGGPPLLRFQDLHDVIFQTRELQDLEGQEPAGP